LVQTTHTMKLPLIGLTTDHSPSTDARTFAKGVDIYYLNDVYIRYVEKTRCLFVGLPTTEKQNIAPDIINRLDGLLLTGGNDVFSGAYGETPLSDQWQSDAPRTFFEIELITQALQQKKPILGICRGFQMLNTALGGSLYQDIATQVVDAMQHRSPNKPVWNHHPVQVREHSLLHRVTGKTTFQVSSSHHQGIKKLASPLNAVAWAADGLIEAVESPGHKFVLGVQWHPEVMGDDPTALALLHEFVNACRD
jgi:putative glutamine amidotransferase